MKLRYLTWLTLLMVYASVGCTSFTTNSLCWWKKETVSERPTRVVEFWKEDVLTVDGVTTRGFGGRLVFYDANQKNKENGHDQSVKITGRLTIYAFDDSEYEQGSSAAEKKFVFEPDQLEKAYRETSLLGHSYCFWLPWDHDVDAPRRKICLIAVLENLDGQPVLRSTEANHIQLPGCPPEDSDEQSLRKTEVQKFRIVGEDTDSRLISEIDGRHKNQACDPPSSSNSRTKATRQAETISLHPNGSFAQPGASGAELPATRAVQLPKIHQREPKKTKSDDSDSTKKSQGTQTVLNGPLNESTTSVDSLSEVLHLRNGLTIGNATRSLSE